MHDRSATDSHLAPSHLNPSPGPATIPANLYTPADLYTLPHSYSQSNKPGRSQCADKYSVTPNASAATDSAQYPAVAYLFSCRADRPSYDD